MDVVTLARRKSLRDITSGAISSIPKVNRIVLGDGGVDANGDPKEPSEDMTALFHQVAEYQVEEVEYPDDLTARYRIVVPEDELGGVSISEAGLMDEAGTLCSIKTFYIKRKDLDVEFELKFDDQF